MKILGEITAQNKSKKLIDAPINLNYTLPMNAKLKEQILRNLTALDTEELYANMLDDVYGEVEIAGMSFQTSRALKELDPTAFRCGMVDYIDSLSLVEIDGDYYEFDACDVERDELVSELESEISDLEAEISDLESEIEDLEEEESDSAEDAKEILAQINSRRESIEGINSKIAAINEEIAEINNSL